MGRTTSLRRAIKKAFVPHVREKGFLPDMRDAPQFLTFRRVTPEAVHVFDIQWEKYGRPRFVLNFGKCSAKGVICRGVDVLPGDVCPVHTPTCGRLAPGRRATTGGWFRQDRPLLARLFSSAKLHSPEVVVSQLIALFAEVEDFWESEKMGPHIRLLPFSASLAGKDVSP